MKCLSLIREIGGLMSDNLYVKALVLVYEIRIRSLCVLWYYAVV